MRHMFDIPKEAECRLWQRYMTNRFELLSTSRQTLEDVGIYGGQVGVLSGVFT